MGDYWQLTVDVLQAPDNPIVDKPKLVEKYLTKPPFRYLHDIVTAVQNNTGFAPGLYAGDELDAKAIQDKDAKVNYLSKIINVVGLVLGQPVPAKPLKIVAGLEPENTNVFLQMLGQACRVSNGEAEVQRVLNGESQQEAGGASQPAEPAARPTTRPSSQLQQGTDPDEGEPPAAEQVPKLKKSSSSSERKSSRSSKAAAAEEPPPAPAPRSTSPAAPAPPKLGRSESKSRSKPRDDDGLPGLGPPESPGLPPSNSLMGSGGSGGPMVRPQSARKAPPKVAGPAPAAPGATGIRSTGPRSSGMGDGRPGSQQGSAAPRPIAVMEEGARGDSDDDVEVVHEARPVAVGAARGEGEGGVLVRNIIEAEKNLKKAADGSEEGGGTGIILKRAAKPTAVAGAAGPAVKTTDTAAIRELVQKLCQSSHPLAKSMDYLAEDLENMSKEYRFWQVERRVFADKLADEQRLVGDSSAAEAQLADLDGQIKQVRDRIMGIKAQVLRNDETISKLLGMAVGMGGR